MPISKLTVADLRLTVDPESLGFADTSELLEHALSWIGQDRAEIATHFGLGMDQADYNLFVLGEVGSGRSSLLKQAMQTAASKRAIPPDLCYLYNFDAPEHPRALRLPAGQGRLLRQCMARMMKVLLTEIPQQLDGPDFKVESEHITKTYKEEESKAYAELDAFGEARNFTMHRESGQLLFTLRGKEGHAMTEDEMFALPKEQRAEIAQAEQELLPEINRYFEKTRPLERVMNESLAALRRQVVKPLLDRELREIRAALKKKIKDSVKLGAYLKQVTHDILDNLELFKASETDDELRKEEVGKLLSRYRVNLVVDNDGLSRCTGDRRRQSPVPLAVRQHRISIRERCPGDGLFPHPRRQPAQGARRLPDAASARPAGRRPGLGKAAAFPAQRPPADRGTGYGLCADCRGFARTRVGGCRCKDCPDRLAQTVLRIAGGRSRVRAPFSRQGGLCRKIFRQRRRLAAHPPSSSPIPAKNWGCPIFPQPPSRVCWNKGIAKQRTGHGKAPSSATPRPC